MIGIVDVGGGMRGCYAAGILDFCQDEGVIFDSAIGVSAGASNLACYISRQRGRMLRFYRDYSQRPEYMGFGNLIRTGSFLGLDYMFHTIADEGREDPFDYEAFFENRIPFEVVATEAETGCAKYFDRSEIKVNDCDIMAASANLPGVDRAFFYKGVPYFDGALSDPIPYERLFAHGCDKVIVLLTRPLEKRRDPKSDRLYVKMMGKKYPAARSALASRAELYNSQADGMQRYIDEGRLMVIYPDDTCGVTTVKRKPENITALYAKGYEAGRRIVDFL